MENSVTFVQYGALLAAIAHVMMQHNVSAVAARGGNYDALLLDHMMANGLDGVEAQRLLDQVELSEAVNMQ